MATGPLAWIDRRAPWLVIGALAIGVLACSLTIHEYWRDECQAALLAEHTPVGELIGALRYEGHPPLLHVLLKITSILPRPYGLSIVGAIGFATLLVGIYRWLRAFPEASPRVATLATAALAMTYTVGYELGVVARGYGYGIGLALIGASLAKPLTPRDPWKRFLPVVLCLGGSILSALHTAVLASSIALAFTISVLRVPGARVVHLRLLAQKLALPLAPFAAILLIVVIEPADRDFPWVPSGFHLPAEPAAVTWRLALHVFATEGWWSIEIPPLAAIAITVAMLAGVGFLVFVRRGDDKLGWFTTAATINTLVIVVLCVGRYFGEYRHHTIVVVPWVLCLAGAAIASPRSRIRLIAIPLALWFAHQVWLFVGSIHRDALQAFSQSRAIARALPPDAHVAASHDALATCIGYHRPDVELRSVQGEGRVFTFVHWDRARGDRVRIEDVVRAACAGRRSVYLVVGEDETRLVSRFDAGPNLLEPIDPRFGRALPDEYFRLHEVSCVAKALP